ncbi:acyl-CoA Delta-9 desaturase-like [Leguminivora glycinivorella]|uniref:acyl-CoA Delta-9 desaturase-like n=1 Tax=Leguminivora glycinivorella TaxID=1035111 RepID=UPI00200C5079|nr:acyl-CoA Delta-9 desaturase-like [Leguminivora glycinivorella]
MLHVLELTAVKTSKHSSSSGVYAVSCASLQTKIIQLKFKFFDLQSNELKMPPQATDANGVLFEGDAETEDVALAKKPVRQAAAVKWDYIWHMIVVSLFLNAAGVYGGYRAVVSAKWPTILLAYILYVASIIGIAAGAHRLWSHKSYKAKWPLQLILMIFHTTSLQYSVINWARDHRMHHKYVDTDADPHNATRGFFFSHVGWLMLEKHPEYERKSKQLDISDLENNPILHFQQKYYVVLVAIICVMLPTVIPVYFWNETWTDAFLVSVLFRHASCLNATSLVNSALHKWGYKPYDKNMLATELSVLDPIILGENYHNFHHAFPWDYKTSELGGTSFRFTTAFINFFARIGWAYDLKTISDDIIQKRVIRTGDGSHNIWGWGDKDQAKEEVNAAVRIYPKDD